MAEEEKKPEKKRKAWFPKLRNWLVVKSNKYLHTHFHEIMPEGYLSPTLLQIYEDLQKEIKFSSILEMNNEMVLAEQMWDGGHPEWDAKSADRRKKEVQDLYFDLGHFCDIRTLALEHNIIQEGTKKYRSGYIVENGRRRTTSKEEQYEKRKLKMNIQEIGEKEFEFLVPYEEEIVFNHGLRYKIAFLGTGNILEFFRDLKRNVMTFLDKIKLQLQERHRADPQIVDNIEKNLENIKLGFSNSIENLSFYYDEFEHNHRSYMSAKETRVSEYGTLMEEVKKLRLKPYQVVYRHTYRVINIEKFQKALRESRLTFEIRPNEVDDGLDENGWPLEVAEENYNFRRAQEDGSYVNEPVPDGTVLLDVFNGKEPYRKVPPELFEECTEYVDLLELATWVYTNYDAYRDDLRDGRYHEKSLSIMEYILRMWEIHTNELEFQKANLDQPIWIDKKNERDEIERDNAGNPIRIVDTKHMKTTMQLKGPPPGRPEKVEWEITPTHLNPAFDLRRGRDDSSKKDLHLGRKLYYDLQENTEQSVNPSMTTRGAALYIVAKVIERVKYWHEAVELFETVGNQTSGYDIGPNIMGVVSTDEKGRPKVDLQRWGKPLTKNPFKPITGPR